MPVVIVGFLCPSCPAVSDAVAPVASERISSTARAASSRSPPSNRSDVWIGALERHSHGAVAARARVRLRALDDTLGVAEVASNAAAVPGGDDPRRREVDDDGNVATWGEHVTDDEYAAAPAPDS
jgi:hypothetical protein